MSAESIAERLRGIIDEAGPIPVSTFVEHALYGPGGFYMAGGRAGRRGDFLTAPEVGPLFGAVVAAAVDGSWRELGRPEEFSVYEWGAGPGTLARSVLAAEPEVLSSGALRWVMVERSVVQRELHPVHARVESIAPDDVRPVETGVVLANELLDNLPFDIVEWHGEAWHEVRVGVAGVRFVEQPGPQRRIEGLPANGVGEGARVPHQPQAREWLRRAIKSIDRGRVVVFDYGATTAELVARDGAWLRTHAGHTGAVDWLADPGSCDITTDVDLDQLQLEHPADIHELQADWLRRHGIDDLVEEGREVWEASAGVGDLAALRGRSRVREAEALTDPAGMGAFHALEWLVEPRK